MNCDYAMSGDLHRLEMEPHGIRRRRWLMPKAPTGCYDWLDQIYKTVGYRPNIEKLTALICCIANTLLNTYVEIYNWKQINLRCTTKLCQH